MRHWPALKEKVLEILRPRSGGIYFDGTVGEGGHAEAILELSSPRGRLIGVDVDSQAIISAEENLRKYGDRVILLRENYRRVKEILQSLGIERVDGILLDLGVSSQQLDNPSRGFSFLRSGPLDMRMDLSLERSAYQVVNESSEEELGEIIRDLGEEPRYRRVARAIVSARKKKPIESTGELAELVKRSLVKPGWRYRRHPATRVFQALRIAVNQELENLRAFLPVAFSLLVAQGRMVIISYHSLEDRIVKNFFKSLSAMEGRVIEPAPIRPTSDEISASSGRVRSAKLRAVERIKW